MTAWRSEMHKKLIHEYVCPYTRKHMALEGAVYDGDEVREGRLVSPSGQSFIVQDGIPVFLE
jgi:uncharacterized protein YbaR (Trm112 family)